MRRSTLTCVLAAVIASLWVSSAFGQDLDGTWLKLTVKARGIRVDDAADSAPEHSVSAKQVLHARRV